MGEIAAVAALKQIPDATDTDVTAAIAEALTDTALTPKHHTQVPAAKLVLTTAGFVPTQEEQREARQASRSPGQELAESIGADILEEMFRRYMSMRSETLDGEASSEPAERTTRPAERRESEKE